jgi:hypothetical protein
MGGSIKKQGEGGPSQVGAGSVNLGGGAGGGSTIGVASGVVTNPGGANGG